MFVFRLARAQPQTFTSSSTSTSEKFFRSSCCENGLQTPPRSRPLRLTWLPPSSEPVHQPNQQHELTGRESVRLKELRFQVNRTAAQEFKRISSRGYCSNADTEAHAGSTGGPSLPWNPHLSSEECGSNAKRLRPNSHFHNDTTTVHTNDNNLDVNRILLKTNCCCYVSCLQRFYFF